MNHLLTLLLVIFSVTTLASSANNAQITDDFVTYVRIISPSIKINSPSEGATALNAIHNISRIMRNGSVPPSGILHKFTGISYGNSFLEKNAAPINHIVKQLTGRGDWCREGIENTDTHIADIGCGLGLSTASLIIQVGEIYEAEGWDLEFPIRIDLYDINPENQDALRALARLVNNAYPKYFNVTATTYDITKESLFTVYDVILALNVMHYIPENLWGLSVRNISDSMKNQGKLLVTVDYKTDESEELFTSGGISFAGAVFFTPNYYNVLLEEIEYIPGKSYPTSSIDLSKLNNLFTANFPVTMYWSGRQSVCPDYSLINKLLSLDSSTISLWPYQFNHSTLTQAILQHSDGSLLTAEANWPNELSRQAAGRNAGKFVSAGAMFIKSSSVDYFASSLHPDFALSVVAGS